MHQGVSVTDCIAFDIKQLLINYEKELRNP